MTESTQFSFTPAELDQLQRLRLSVLAFQQTIAALPADEQNNARNEQFNQLRLEARALLKERGFEKRVTRAITEEVLTERLQKVILPRLSAIIILGVILALVGLGINSIVLEDLVINSLACLVSSGGMLLILGAFAVFGLTRLRRRISNLGDVYLHGTVLLHEINHALNMTIPGLAERPEVNLPEIPSIVELALDSLNKQAADWQHKLRGLEEQRLTLGPDTPLELNLNLDFARREMNRVRQEIERLHGRTETPSDLAEKIGPDGEERVATEVKVIVPPGVREAVGPPVEQPVDSRLVERARSVTMDMPPIRTGPDPETLEVDTDETSGSG